MNDPKVVALTHEQSDMFRQMTQIFLPKPTEGPKENSNIFEKFLTDCNSVISELNTQCKDNTIIPVSLDTDTLFRGYMLTSSSKTNPSANIRTKCDAIFSVSGGLNETQITPTLYILALVRLVGRNQVIANTNTSPQLAAALEDFVNLVLWLFGRATKRTSKRPINKNTQKRSKLLQFLEQTQVFQVSNNTGILMPGSNKFVRPNIEGGQKVNEMLEKALAEQEIKQLEKDQIEKAKSKVFTTPMVIDSEQSLTGWATLTKKDTWTKQDFEIYLKERYRLFDEELSAIYKLLAGTDEDKINILVNFTNNNEAKKPVFVHALRCAVTTIHNWSKAITKEAKKSEITRVKNTVLFLLDNNYDEQLDKFKKVDNEAIKLLKDAYPLIEKVILKYNAMVLTSHKTKYAETRYFAKSLSTILDGEMIGQYFVQVYSITKSNKSILQISFYMMCFGYNTIVVGVLRGFKDERNLLMTSSEKVDLGMEENKTINVEVNDVNMLSYLIRDFPKFDHDKFKKIQNTAEMTDDENQKKRKNESLDEGGENDMMDEQAYETSKKQKRK